MLEGKVGEKTYMTPLSTVPLKSWVSPSRRSSNPPPNLLQAASNSGWIGKGDRHSRHIAKGVESELISDDERAAEWR